MPSEGGRGDTREKEPYAFAGNSRRRPFRRHRSLISECDLDTTTFTALSSAIIASVLTEIPSTGTARDIFARSAWRMLAITCARRQTRSDITVGRTRYSALVDVRVCVCAYVCEREGGRAGAYVLVLGRVDTGWDSHAGECCRRRNSPLDCAFNHLAPFRVRRGVQHKIFHATSDRGLLRGHTHTHTALWVEGVRV